MLQNYPFMRYLFFIIAICLFSCSIGKLTTKGVYKEVSATEFYNYVKDSTINIIDLRTEKEYQKSHIKGAINISYFGGEFKKDINSTSLNKELPTLIYCETQHRSLWAANKIYKAGFKNVIDLDKGMSNWRKNGFPYEK